MGIPPTEFFVELHLLYPNGEVTGNEHKVIVTPRYAASVGRPFTREGLIAELHRLVEEMVDTYFDGPVV